MRKYLSAILLALASCTEGASATTVGVYDGDGVLLGTYLSSSGESVQFVSRTGYVAKVKVSNEIPGSSPPGSFETTLDSAWLWTTSNCTGPAYSGTAVTGRIVRIEPDTLGYVPSNATAVTLVGGTSASRYQWNGSQYVCQPTTVPDTKFYVPAYPNDPSVTGILGSNVTLPLKIALIDAVFEDGFEYVV